MKTFLVKQDLLQATLTYLAARPYQEVAGLVQALQACKPVEQTAAVEQISEPTP